MRTFSCALALFGMASSVRALPTAETLRAMAADSFRTISLQTLPAIRAETTPSTRAAAPRRHPGSRILRFTGQAHVRGRAFVPRGMTHAHVILSGWAKLQDQNGRPIDEPVALTASGLYPVVGNFVSGLAHPYAYISVYDQALSRGAAAGRGAYLGLLRVDGTVFVSGYNNAGWLEIYGSGQVSGSLIIPSPSSTPR